MLINNVVGNPPYNGPGRGRPPIYHTITELQNRYVQPNNFAWIVQYNWITQLSPVGVVMRKNLLDMGVTLIEDNKFQGFTEATVRTCTIYCSRGYRGKIQLRDRTSGQTVEIAPEQFEFLAQSPCYSDAERDLLRKFVSASTDSLGFPQSWTTESAGVPTGSPYPRYAISVTYFADFIQGGIGKLRAVGPDQPIPGSQRIFKNYTNLNNRAEAELVLQRMNSFWTSNTVKFILNRTLTSRTLDNPQIAWVPVVPMDRIWDDQKLAEYFNLTPREIEIINGSVISKELVFSPTDIITESIARTALNESKNRAVFRTGERKDSNGEVFTPTPLALHMLSQLPPESWTQEQTFFDPTCGNGQILAAVATIKRELGHINYLEKIFGMDLMPDNVAECRERLLAIAGNTEHNRNIVNKNIRQADALDPSSYAQFTSIQERPIELL